MRSLLIDEHLVLDTIDVKYATEIFRSFDKNIIEYLPIDKPPDEITETENFIKLSVQGMESGNDMVWAILHDLQFIGCCGIHSIKSKKPHFGIWIRKEGQGKGYGQKVVEYVLKWALKSLDVEYIKYPVDARNVKSIKLIEKLNIIPSDRYIMGDMKKLDILEYRLFKKKE